jgi:hypothetical protein
MQRHDMLVIERLIGDRVKNKDDLIICALA